MTTQQLLDVPPRLNGRHHRTYEAIFRLPPAHNLAWHDVRSLLDNLADVTESDHDSFRAMKGGQELVLHVPQYKDFVTGEDLLTVRRFLTQTGDPAAAGNLLVARAAPTPLA